MDRRLRIWGRNLASLQDDLALASVDLDRGRRRLLDTAARRFRSRTTIAAMAGAPAIAMALALVLFLRHETPLGFRVGASENAGEMGAWLVAPPNDALPIVFTDGTKVVLDGGARAVVVGSDAHGARVLVESGMVHVSVVHRNASQWRLNAGPFEVRVTGTKFDLSWRPEMESFSVTLHEGRVVVSGPVVGADRALDAGETLDVSPRLAETRAEVTRAAAPTLERDEEPTTIDAGAPLDATRARPSRLPPHGLRPDGSSFVKLAQTGQYEESLAVAERTGFAEVCRTAPAGDLLLLGDAARLTGHDERAIEAYAAVATRFRGSVFAQATFLLGRLEMDRRRAYREAVTHFEASLREQPDGPYAREAAGRRIEALARSGDTPSARAAAARYLERYPDGPFADTARALLANE